MTNRTRIILGTTALIAVIAAAMPTNAVRKCRGAPNGNPIYLVDGRIIPTPATQPGRLSFGVDAQDVHSIEVVCMNPQDSTLNTTEGVQAVSVWTKTGPFAQVSEVLEKVSLAQADHHRRTSQYIDDVAALPLDGLPAGVSATLTQTTRDWTVTARFDGLLAYCSVRGGAMSSAPTCHGR